MFGIFNISFWSKYILSCTNKKKKCLKSVVNTHILDKVQHFENEKESLKYYIKKLA